MYVARVEPCITYLVYEGGFCEFGSRQDFFYDYALL